MLAKVSRETFFVALDALRSNKVRALLTMLGVVIGSACIVLVVGLNMRAQDSSPERSATNSI